ncbi:MAG: hypothetical protein WBL35_07660 [Ornithinibacter sp.]
MDPSIPRLLPDGSTYPPVTPDPPPPPGYVSPWEERAQQAGGSDEPGAATSNIDAVEGNDGEPVREERS